MKLLFCLMLPLFFAIPAHAQTDEEAPRVVGVYAPQVLFASALARTGFAQQIASQLASKTGLKIVGRGFATRGDFDQQVKAGRVHFAVIGAPLQARRGYPALAQGQSGGKSARAMVLATQGGKNISTLKGTTLAGVSKSDRGLVMNYLLQGQVPPGYFKFKPARDVQAALGLVKLGRAGGAFTFAGNTAGLDAAFISRPMPLPVFVQTDKTLGADVAGKVRGAIGGVALQNGTVSGFGGVDQALLGRIKGALNSSPRMVSTAPVLAPVRGALPPVPEFMERSTPPVILPAAGADVVAPAAPADAF
jgi:hypothetical protein